MIAAGVEVEWQAVCALEDLVDGAGACALFDGEQVAILRLHDRVFAVDNFDPFSRAFVISRGIVGDRGGRPIVASPIYKHTFDLESGRSLDDASVLLRVWPARVRAGRVELRRP